MPSAFIPSEGGVRVGTTDFRGWLSWDIATSATQSVITLRATAEAKRGYSRWVRLRLYRGGALIAELIGRHMGTFGDWAWLGTGSGSPIGQVTDTGTITSSHARTTTDQAVAVRAVIDIDSRTTPNSSHPNWDSQAISHELGRALTIPARVDAPQAPTGLTATRANDNRADLAWTRRTGTYSPYDGQDVLRSVDGGPFAFFRAIPGTASSWQDLTVQPNHSYAYQVRAWNKAGSAASGASATVYNTPAAPGRPEAARLSATQVRVTMENPGLTQDSTEFQRSPNGTSGWSASVAVAGEAVRQLDDTPGSTSTGYFYYRARNVRGSGTGALYSAWSPVSEGVVTLTAPAAPTLTAPASGTVVRKDLATATLAWRHNPIDGSPQTAAELRHSTNGGAAWATVSVSGAAQSRQMQTSLWAVGAEVTWQVRTRGQHASFGPWSATGSFTAAMPPQVVLLSPAQGFVLGDMPLAIQWAYSDQSGGQSYARASLTDASGLTVWEAELDGPGTEAVVGAADFLPQNGASYTARVEVRSTSSLSASAAASFTVDYVPPAGPEAIIEGLGPAAAVDVTAFAGAGGAGVPATAAVGIFRRHGPGSPGGERLVALLGSGPSGSGVRDLFPPLDEPFEYVVVAYTATGVSSQAAIPAEVRSEGCAVVNYGEGLAAVARVALDMGHSRMTEHSREVYETAGEDPWPLVFYGGAARASGTVTGTALRGAGPALATAADIEALARWTGPCVLRLPGEGARMADVTVSQAFSRQGAVEVDVAWTQVRADGLAF